jgi:ABC-2 type transport system permease protein
MWLRLKTTIIKELQSYLRDRAAMRFLIGAPVFQTIIFAFAATLDVQNIDIAVFDQDAGRWSHELVARVDAAWFTDELLVVHNAEEMNALISERRVLVGLRIGPEFSRDLNGGEQGHVQVLVDGRRANAAQISVRYLASIVAEMGAELGAGFNTAAGVATMPSISLRHWFNTNLNYRWFMVANLAAVQAMMLCLVITSLSISREREMGTFDQLLVSPVTSLEIVIAKTVPGFIGGFIVSVLVSLIAVFVFGSPFTGSVTLYVFGLMIFILSVVGVGLLISAVCQTQQQAILGTFFGSIPFILTSGFATPVENMPEWMQQVVVINPLKHFLLVVQGSFFKSQSTAQIMVNIWPLIPIALLTMTVATVVVRRKLQ